MQNSVPRAGTGAEARFWALLLLVLALAIHGWYAGELEARIGHALVPGDGTVHPRELLVRLAAYGSAGRQAYVAYLSLACLVPVAGSMAVLRLYQLLGEPDRYRRTLTTVAVLPALCALVENTLCALLAITYPRAGSELATLAYGITVAKVLASAAAVLALAVLASVWLRRRVDADPHETI